MPVKKGITPKGYMTVKDYAASQIGYNEQSLKTAAVYYHINKHRKNPMHKVPFEYKIVESNTFIKII